MIPKYTSSEQGEKVTEAVNEAFDKLPKEEQDELMGIGLAFKDKLTRLHFAEMKGGRPPAFGEVSAVELLGKIGIFMVENGYRDQV
jgi:hypothetical protein